MTVCTPKIRTLEQSKSVIQKESIHPDKIADEGELLVSMLLRTLKPARFRSFIKGKTT